MTIGLTELEAVPAFVVRVQCKFIAGREVDLRRIHSNANGYVVKRTVPNAYDWLYVLKPDGREYLLKECFADRRSVTRLDVHELGAVAESG